MTINGLFALKSPIDTGVYAPGCCAEISHDSHFAFLGRHLRGGIYRCKAISVIRCFAGNIYLQCRILNKFFAIKQIWRIHSHSHVMICIIHFSIDGYRIYHLHRQTKKPRQLLGISQFEFVGEFIISPRGYISFRSFVPCLIYKCRDNMRKYVTTFAENGLRMYFAGKLTVEEVAFDTHGDGRGSIVGTQSNIIHLYGGFFGMLEP